MPRYKIPPLQDDREFENLVADYYKMQYNLPIKAVELYGRRGQKQEGIDIVIIIGKKLWCVQCKNQTKLSVTDIDSIIKNCTFYNKRPFEKLVIATAAPCDTGIINYLNELRQKQVTPYYIEYLYWERICSFIENTPGLYKKYYKDLDSDDPLRNSFFELIKKYEVPFALRIDPMVEGIPSRIPLNLDLLVIELDILLDNYIGRNDLIYRKITEFRYAIDCYNGNIAITLFMDPVSCNRFIYLPPYSGSDTMYEEKSKRIEYGRYYLSNLLSEITNL